MLSQWLTTLPEGTVLREGDEVSALGVKSHAHDCADAPPQCLIVSVIETDTKCELLAFIASRSPLNLIPTVDPEDANPSSSEKKFKISIQKERQTQASMLARQGDSLLPGLCWRELTNTLQRLLYSSERALTSGAPREPIRKA